MDCVIHCLFSLVQTALLSPTRRVVHSILFKLDGGSYMFLGKHIVSSCYKSRVFSGKYCGGFGGCSMGPVEPPFFSDSRLHCLKTQPKEPENGVFDVPEFQNGGVHAPIPRDSPTFCTLKFKLRVTKSWIPGSMIHIYPSWTFDLWQDAWRNDLIPCSLLLLSLPWAALPGVSFSLFPGDTIPQNHYCITFSEIANVSWQNP